ncbi:MAG TPA: serine/threonine-protein kinase [Planctomycetota bacterium]|nr:serine/threonine-protein kinase [Planctomycetota bacterium]
MTSSSGRLPALFGDYKVERVVARGGMGAVFEVRHRMTGARCAAKTLLKTNSEQSRARFRREAELLARCDRIPGIVKVHTFGETPQGEPFMILDFVDGPSLDARLVEGDRLAARDAAALVRDVARALGAIHAQGMIHRDVKPGNILIDAQGKPWLTDFGLAAARDLDRLTRTGAFLGTVAYAAPEQAAGEPCTPASDVFSLGCVLFHALAGEVPIESDSAMSHMAQLSDPRPIRDVRTVAQTVPAPLASIVARCLEKDPERRYETGEELARDLDRFLEGKPIEGAVRPRPRGITVALATLLVLALVLFLVRSLRNPSSDRPATPVAHTPVSLDDWESDGDARLQAGDIAAAASSYGNALRLAPPTRARGLHEKRAGMLASLGRDDEALADLHAIYSDLDRVPNNRNANKPLERAAPALYRKGLASKDARLLEAAWRLAPPPKELELAASAFWSDKAAAESETWSQGFLAGMTATEKEVRAAITILEPASRVRSAKVRFFKGCFASSALALVRGWVRNQDEAATERLGRLFLHDWPDEAFSYFLLGYSRRKTLDASHDEGIAFMEKAMELLPDPDPTEDDESKRFATAVAVTAVELYEVGRRPMNMELLYKTVKHGNHADAWLYLGHALRNAHRFEESNEAIEKAANLPLASNGFYRPAQLEGERLQNLIHLGRREEARKGALELASHPGTLADGIPVLVTLEAWDEVVARIDPAHVESELWIYWDALALAHLGRKVEAEKLLPRLEARSKDWAQAVRAVIAANK